MHFLFIRQIFYFLKCRISITAPTVTATHFKSFPNPGLRILSLTASRIIFSPSRFIVFSTPLPVCLNPVYNLREMHAIAVAYISPEKSYIIVMYSLL